MYADLAAQFEWETRVGHSLVVEAPVGVVACITPWNYPLHQITGKVAPALVAGCTVVLKPSEIAPPARSYWPARLERVVCRPEFSICCMAPGRTSAKRW